MADKTVIVKIEYDTTEAVKSLEDLTAVIEGEKVAQAKLKAELESGQKSQKEYSAEVEQSKDAQKKANTERQETIKLLSSEKGSLNELKANISALTKERNKLNLSTDEGRKRYRELNTQIVEQNKSLKLAQTETKKTAGVFGSFGKSIKEIPGPIGGIINGFVGMTKAAWAFVANPIGAVIAALAAAVGLVIKAFKTFQPILDWIEQKIAAVSAVFTVLKEAVVSLFTGQKDLNEAFKGMGAEMKKAADEAVRLKKAEQDLEDMAIRLIASQEKYKTQIDQLLLQSKNRTKSEKERMALIDEALAIEEKAFKERQVMADGEYEQALGKIINGRSITDEQKKNLREQGVAYAQLLQETKGISDDEVIALANAEAKKEQIMQESISLREKAMNRQDVLEEKAAEKSAAMAAKKKEDDAKASEERIKQIQAEGEALRLLDEQKVQEDEYERELMESLNADIIENDANLKAALTESDKAFADEKLRIYKENLENELAAKREIEGAKAALTNEIVSAAQKIATDQFNSFIDNDLNAYRENAQAQENILKNQLDKGTISEAQYQKQIKALKLKVRKEEAKAEKKKALFDIAINTATAVVKALPNIPLSIIVGALGLASAISVAAKPEPKFAKGGIIGGKSHAQGGTRFIGSDGSSFEAERGEAMFVLKKNATEEIAALSAINESFGGRSFTTGASNLQEGGNVQPVDVEGMVNRAMRQTPIVVKVSDVALGLSSVDKVKSVGVI